VPGSIDRVEQSAHFVMLGYRPLFCGCREERQSRESRCSRLQCPAMFV
jgi:hypothetical protein